MTLNLTKKEAEALLRILNQVSNPAKARIELKLENMIFERKKEKKGVSAR